LITKKVDVNLTNNIKYYENLGYLIQKIKDKQGNLTVKRGTVIKVKVKDLPDNSNIRVNVKCDCKDCINPYLKPMTWQNYLKHIHENGEYYCQICSIKLFGKEKRLLSMLKNGKSFQQWCIDNNRQDILDRWDYELNNCSPNNVLYATHNKYYFKCYRGLHESELKNIGNFTTGSTKNIQCNQCNSFAQWGIDNLGENFLEKYWDYEKNTVDPWEIAKSSINTKVWLRCQEKDYHGSYDIHCCHFIKGTRCSFCVNRKIHYLDSLGTLYPQVFEFWSDRNNKSPYEYPPMSSEEVYWKCPEGIHEDYLRNIYHSNTLNFRCPECQYSKGEEKICNYFIDLSFIKINQEDYKLLDDMFKGKYKYYIPQKKFDGLVGLGEGNLSYDFYLPNYNLLIEYQGQQHEKYCKGFHKSKKDFEKQLEHDKRKKEYTQKHNINLLEIWYWDFDNVEEILENELRKIKEEDLKEVG